jgi:two-component system sensor histidine kinase CiaH
MAGHRPREVRRRSIRVALAAAGIVGLLYVAISAGVMVIVTGTLTQKVDDRLTAALASVAATGGLGDEATPRPDDGRPADDDRQFGPPILFWKVAAAGAATYVGPSNYAVDLPASYASIGAPKTVVVNGSSLRMAGRQIGSSYYVTAQTLVSVSEAQATLALTEVLVAPFLLLVVFAGAVVIGRRVAAPIEQARRRELEFTADASHELRTPLSVIEAHTSLALAQPRTTQWYESAFQHVEAESLRMRKLLDDLLWLARFDATQTPINNEPVDLGLLAGAAAERFRAVAEAHHQSLLVAAPADGLIVTAPAEWLDRLIGVLLDNACKYSPEGGSIVVAVQPERNRVVLSVGDSGPGIPEAERSRVFDRFHRATDARSGAGLGLAIGDAIVRATGGHWRIGETPSGGARISVSWQRSGPRPAEGIHASTGNVSVTHDAASRTAS